MNCSYYAFYISSNWMPWSLTYFFNKSIDFIYIFPLSSHFLVSADKQLPGVNIDNFLLKDMQVYSVICRIYTSSTTSFFARLKILT